MAKKKFTLFRSQSVRQASALLAITGLVSNGLGLARNLVFYRVIPPGQLDVYFASFRIADLLFNILIVGAVSSAVIPTISGLITAKDEERAWEVTNQLLTWTTFIMVGVMLLLSLFMREIILGLVPGFDPKELGETVSLSRLLLIQAIFFAWSFIIGSLLNSYRRFSGYALAPLIYNASIIIGGLLAGRYGLNVLVYSVVIGAFLHMSIQLTEAVRLGFRPKVNLARGPELRSILSLMLPRSVSQGMSQVVLLAYTNLSSTLPQGSLAIFNGMNDLQTTPTVIVANSLATASFPALAAQVSSNQLEEAQDLIQKVIRACLFLMLPTAILGWLLRAQVTRLYVGIGAEGWGLTLVAIATFAWFMVGIVPSALVAILARVFYATNDTRTPMIVSISTSLIGICLSWIGIRSYHGNVSMLALSETAIATSQAVVYLLILHHRKLTTFNLTLLFGPRYTYLIGSCLAALGAWITLHLVNGGYILANYGGTTRVMGLLVQTVLASTVGLLIYFRYSSLQNKEELGWLSKRFSKDR